MSGSIKVRTSAPIAPASGRDLLALALQLTTEHAAEMCRVLGWPLAGAMASEQSVIRSRGHNKPKEGDPIWVRLCRLGAARSISGAWKPTRLGIAALNVKIAAEKEAGKRT